MPSSDEGDENFQDTPSELLEVHTENVRVDLLTEKSREAYWGAYNAFIKWKYMKKIDVITENIMIEYFDELASKYKPTSLWSRYSMLKSTIEMKHNIKLDEFKQLLAFLKQRSSGYEPKKSKALSIEEAKKFLHNAPDNRYLVTKVALIFGLYGFCHHCELVNVTVDDVVSDGNIIRVTLRDSKNKLIRDFVIEGEPVKLVLKYQALRPRETSSDRFFLTYRDGECINQVLGKNKFGSMPKEIAKYLRLPNPELYSGHAFRKLAATLFANEGIAMTDFKKRWKSSVLAEGLIRFSLDQKMKTSKKVTNVITRSSCGDRMFEPELKKQKSEVCIAPAPIPITRNSIKKNQTNIQFAHHLREQIDSGQRSTAQNFVKDFKDLVKKHGFTNNNIYNADEATIHWRSLDNDKNYDRKRNKEHITALFCANASASHKLPLLIVEKQPDEKWIKDVNKLPLIYKTQPNSWIDREIFQNWYENHFVPSVKAEQKARRSYGKVLLLLDAAPSHPPKVYFDSVDPNFQVFFIPLLISSLIQPMEQEVISKTKILYMESVRDQLSKGSESRHDCGDYYQISTFNRIEGCNILASAWADIPPFFIMRSWNKLIEPFSIKTEIIDTHDSNATDDDFYNFQIKSEESDTNIIIEQEEVDKLDLNMDYSNNRESTRMLDHSVFGNQITEYVDVKEEFDTNDTTPFVTVQEAASALATLYAFFKQDDRLSQSLHLETLDSIKNVLNKRLVISQNVVDT